MEYIDLVTAVERLAERLVAVVDQDAPLSAWTKRERAIELLYTALRKAVLVAWVEIAPGEYVQLTGIDWTTASLWREIILGGDVRSLPHDPIARYEGLRVLLDEAAFEAWRLDRLAHLSAEQAASEPAGVPAPSGPRPGQQSPKERACKLAEAILNDDAQRPQRVHGWKIKLARLVHARLGPDNANYQVGTIAEHIRPSVRIWEKKHPDD
jgi:hypothetical protein